MFDRTINLLRDLIAIDSVNPSLVPGAVGEKGIADLIVKTLQTAGIDVEVQPVAEGRSNVIGLIDGSRKGRTLMLCGHMDTVGVAGMQTPFDPVEKNGRIYGRGSQDMKVASIIKGGRELSTYPDQCMLKMERRTIKDEPRQCSLAEAENILDQLRAEDPEFTASARFLLGRPPYVTPFAAGNEIAEIVASSIARKGVQPVMGGMSFWTDAAILGESGIPSIVFGPGGAGLHSVSEYVLADDVLTCRDALIDLATEFCSGK